MKLTRRRLLGAGLAAAGAVAAGAVPYIITRRSRPNVLFIISDAMRGDRLGFKRLVGGRQVSLTPHLDAMAREGISFDMAVAPSSWTMTSVPAILYNTSPLNVGYFSGPQLEVRDKGASVIKRLMDSGWFTASVNSSKVLDKDVIRELFRTFIPIKTNPPKYIAGVPRDRDKSSDRANDEVPALMKSLSGPQGYLLYVHYMDTHEPYYCPAQRLSAIGAQYDGEIYTRVVKTDFLSGAKEFRHYKTEIPMAEAVKRLSDHYDASVLNVNESVSRLVAQLDRSSLLDNTIVIFTSDHGEEFADNRETAADIGHCSNLSQQQIRVPLVIWSKAARYAPRSIAKPVSSSRVINSVIEAHAAGKSINDATDAAADDPEPIISLLNYPASPPYKRFNGWSYISGNMKVTGAFGDKGELAGLDAFKIGGPAGMTAIARSPVPQSIVADLERRLQGKGSATFNPDAIDRREREQLRALGYL